VNDTALIEKTSGADPATSAGTSVSFRSGNLCVFCHKSRKDVAFYITASNPISSHRWGPHNGPQSDVYSGKGGFHFDGQAYSSSVHATIADACVSCHMQPVAANKDVPDHTMKPKLDYCKTCHTQYTGTSFDIQGGVTIVRNGLSELQAALNDRALLTRSPSAPFQPLSAEALADRQFHLDNPRPRSGEGGANQVLNAAEAGALYNYLIVARGKDLGVHNPTYAKQLLWDSIVQIKGGTPTSLPSRPE
jgi:hypothetical protein